MILAICFVQAVGNILFSQLSGTIDKTYYEYYKSICKRTKSIVKKNIAKKGNRTLDLHFTRVSLYQLSYFGI